MSIYGQPCPVARAASLLYERWTLLIVRELLTGSRQFNDIHRGLPRMSRTLLSRRLRELIDAGVVERATLPRGAEGYRLTRAGRELEPMVEQMAAWANRWIGTEAEPEQPDPAHLMWDIRRQVDLDRLPSNPVTVKFEFTDVPDDHDTWWLYLDHNVASVGQEMPRGGHDLVVCGACRDLARAWFGDVDLKHALEGGRIRLDGDARLRRSFPRWIGRSPFARAGWRGRYSPASG